MFEFQSMFINTVEGDDDTDFIPLFTDDDEEDESVSAADEKKKHQKEVPVLALKDTVMFSGIAMPITVGREKSLKALQKANKGADKFVAVFSQKDRGVEDPDEADLYSVGVLARILKIIKMPDGTSHAILQGKHRINMKKLVQTEPFLTAKYSLRPDKKLSSKRTLNNAMTAIREKAEKIVSISPNIPNEARMLLNNFPNEQSLMSFLCANLNAEVANKQRILEQDEPVERAKVLLEELEREIQVIELKNDIENKVREDMDKHQRDFFLNQQLKTIQEELGNGEQEINELQRRASGKKWSHAVAAVFEKEINRLRRTSAMTPEYSVLFNYIDFMLELPWNEYTIDDFDLKKAEFILDRDHYGLEKVKNRILEHLAVLKLKGNMKAPILCLVGPPGVGKTSLGKSIAEALGRYYIRMSLGGMHDESEIRGHRKTYLGAMAGRILQSLKKARSANPVFVLDEIDKLGRDHKGDPSSALLEVLDPEQNKAFHDNYLDVDYDLSKILFIATANSLNSIQPALLDRMEIIEIEGYSQEEKIHIAQKHLVAKQLEEHGLKSSQVKLEDKVIAKIIQDYTRESGVRELDRQIAAVMRYVATKVVKEEAYKPKIKVEELKAVLGPVKYTNDALEKTNLPGVAIGLAWTQTGGDILYVEASISKGDGRLTLTGNLGDVMKESVTTAFSFIKANASLLGIEEDMLDKNNVHIHFPAGAIPKDGPSAGITVLSAMTSAFTKKSLRKKLAMTGEITLRGAVLPVGGIREKVLAAKRAGITDIIMCSENKRDVEEIKAEYIEGVNIHYVEQMSEVIKLALEPR